MLTTKGKSLLFRLSVIFIQIILIILKAANVIKCAWVWVFAPSWITILVTLAAIITLLFFIDRR